MKKTALILLLSLILYSCETHQYPFQDTRLSFEERTEDLISRMTLEEKVSQLSYTAGAVEHLGIQEYNWWNECLHGVARAGKATVFPQAIGMAATFDRDVMFRMADITSTEARAKYQDFQSRGKYGIYQGLTFWSPNINIFRDPRWGRGHETYGEDPYLSGEIGVQFVQGLQGDHPRYLKTVATAKHYVVHSGPEPLRHSFDAVVSETDFRDTYLPAFKKLVEDADVYSVMCAYNRYMGEPCCGSMPLQEEILRGELGFSGYIVSDCGAIKDFYDGHNVVADAVDAAALGVLAGTDLNCGWVYPSLVSAVRQGKVSEKDIDVVLTRLMMARMKLGMFDPAEDLPWGEYPIDTVACESHRDVALEMARKSMVLLKNDKQNLPIKAEARKIAVIGPNANNTYVQLGNYNGTPARPVSVYEGIRDRMGDKGEVRFVQGSRHHSGLPYLSTIPPEVLFSDAEGSSPGLHKQIISREAGQMGKVLFEGTDPIVDINIWDGELPLEGAMEDAYTISWKGYLMPRRSGTHALGVYGKYFRLVVEGDTVMKHHNEHHPNKNYYRVDLEKDRAYRIEIIMEDIQGDAPCTLHWEEPDLPLEWEAVQTAKWADHVVLVMGLTARLEGEEMRGLDLEGFYRGDRTDLKLPAVQRNLIRRIAATGKPVTLVLMTGSAVNIEKEAGSVSSVLQAWYGGETAGEAVADILFGDYNPAGRLPLTFYKSVNDLPAFENYDMENRTYRYFGGEVLYPFGYGLSYTTYKYENILLEDEEIVPGEPIIVSVELSNTGPLAGEEVVQLYVEEPEGEGKRPIRSLKGFERVSLQPGQTRVVSIELPADALSRFDTVSSTYVCFPGTYTICAGPSSSEQELLKAELVVR